MLSQFEFQLLVSGLGRQEVGAIFSRSYVGAGRVEIDRSIPSGVKPVEHFDFTFTDRLQICLGPEDRVTGLPECPEGRVTKGKSKKIEHIVKTEEEKFLDTWPAIDLP